jgi:hypothetical protein
MKQAAPGITGSGSLASGFGRIAGVFTLFRSAAAKNAAAVNSPVPVPRRKPAKDPVPASQTLRLRLEFSKAADLPRVQQMLSAPLKEQIDPHNYVAVRESEALKAALDLGGGAFLTGPGSDIFSMAMSYEIREPGKKGAAAQKPDYIEMGSTMSRTPGYNAAQLTLAALTLKQWWDNPPENMFVCEVIPGNAASIRSYSALGWRPITSRALMKDLFFLCNETITSHDKNRETLWFYCDDSVITHQARILLNFMDQGGLLNRQSRSRIAVDFSALDAAGLTRRRLEAMAIGTTDRRKLQAIGPR